jgi:hypothetical protein
MGPYCRWYKSTVCFFCRWLPNCLTHILCLITHATMPLSVCYTPNMCIRGTKPFFVRAPSIYFSNRTLCRFNILPWESPWQHRALPYTSILKEGSLFSFVVMRCTEPGCFRSSSWCLWKALNEEWCMGLIPWRLDLWCKSSWILNDFFTEN